VRPTVAIRHVAATVTPTAVSLPVAWRMRLAPSGAAVPVAAEYEQVGLAGGFREDRADGPLRSRA
jgi:hypothetical protein